MNNRVLKRVFSLHLSQNLVFALCRELYFSSKETGNRPGEICERPTVCSIILASCEVICHQDNRACVVGVGGGFVHDSLP